MARLDVKSWQRLMVFLCLPVLILGVVVNTTPVKAATLDGGWTAPLSSMPSVSTGFLANNCGHPGYGTYITNQYHIANDYEDVTAGDDVYAIGAGTVVAVQSDWPGSAVFVKHQAANGTEFLGVYGHLSNAVANGSTVANGQVVGKIYDDGDNTHLHFGVRAATAPATNNNGNMPCSSWPDANGYVNPMPYLNANAMVDEDPDDDGVLGSADNCPSVAGSANYGGCPVFAENDVLQADGSEYSWRVSFNGQSSWDETTFKDSTVPASSLKVGDFDQDGRVDDIFQATGVSGIGWRVSYNGTGVWEDLKTDTTTTGESLLIGDFDGDGYKDDVFHATGVSSLGWKVVYNGIGGWSTLRTGTSTTADSLAVGNFDGDLYDDIFQATGVSGIGWRYSPDARGGWSQLKDDTSTTMSSILIGNFDGDGRDDDVFQASGTSGIGWRVVYNGIGGWSTLKDDTTSTVDTLMIGDFDEDNRNDDVFQASGNAELGWRVVLNGIGGWDDLKPSTATKNTLLLGDFD